MNRAKGGDPEALRLILEQLAIYLRGDGTFPRESAAFCADALTEFTGSEVMLAAGAAFKDHILRQVEGFAESQDHEAWLSFQEQIKHGKGPRLPNRPTTSGMHGKTDEPTRAAIGREFCQAFGLSKRQGPARRRRDQCPPYVWKIEELLLRGESVTHAIRMARGAVEKPLSATSIRDWLKFVGIEKPQPGTKAAEHAEEKQRNVGFLVEYLVESGLSVEDSCERVALGTARHVLGRSAKVPFQFKTVEAAYRQLLRAESS